MQLKLLGSGGDQIKEFKERIAELEETVHTLISAETAQHSANARQMIENRELKKRVEALQTSVEEGTSGDDNPVTRLQHMVKEMDYQRRLDQKVGPQSTAIRRSVGPVLHFHFCSAWPSTLSSRPALKYTGIMDT